MDHEDVRSFVARIVATRDDEPDPAVVDEMLASYADAVVAGDDNEAAQALLEPFLLQSPETADVLDTLLELARMEFLGRLPSVAELERELASDAGASVPPSSLRSARVAPREPSAVPPWRSRWRVLREAFPAVMAVGAAAAIALSVTGWARADRRADEATVELQALQSALAQLETPRRALAAFEGAPDAAEALDYRALANTVGRATEVRFARMADGAWARVAFSPTSRRALVWAGALPIGDAKTECWLERTDAGRQTPRTLDWLDGDPAWWYIEADKDLSTYDTFTMTMESAEEPVVRVALKD